MVGFGFRNIRLLLHVKGENTMLPELRRFAAFVNDV